jgi:hypothetical protein
VSAKLQNVYAQLSPAMRIVPAAPSAASTKWNIARSAGNSYALYAGEEVMTERDSLWKPEVEVIRKAMMERFSDKLSMEEIADFAYSLAEHAKEQTAPDEFHIALCQACELLNQGDSMRAHLIIRQALSEAEASQSTPDKCPNCGSTDKATRFTSHFAGVPIQDCQDEWHAATPKGSK